tara:strand:+ start:36050 stop:36343 length:294 start_codon:yes stop_codon:yes gene_type:complete
LYFTTTPLNIFNPVYLEWLLKMVGYIEHYNKTSTGLHFSRLRFYSHMFLDIEIGYSSREGQDEIVTDIEKQSFNIDDAAPQCRYGKVKVPEVDSEIN